MITILLVEDDPWLAELQAGLLTRAGYHVTVAAHAIAAIDAVDVALPDVIILDVLLTGSTAFALIHELRSHADTRDVPIILCTNIAEQFSPVHLREYGVARVVDKTTMSPDDIVAAVRAVTFSTPGEQGAYAHTSD